MRSLDGGMTGAVAASLGYGAPGGQRREKKRILTLLAGGRAGLASPHAFHHSGSARACSNFHDVDRRRRAAAGYQPLAFSTGKRVTGKTTSVEEKRILALVTNGENNSKRFAERRGGEDEEAKKTADR